MYPAYPYRGYRRECEQVGLTFPPQHQERQPGLEYLMDPPPLAENPAVRGSGRLAGKAALITGGDSGIGRAVALAFAREGADVAISYLNEHKDAAETRRRVEAQGRGCLVLPADLRLESECARTVGRVMDRFERLDILVCNHAVQYVQPSILDIGADQLSDTFQTNILSYFYLIQAALPGMERGSAIITTTSITAYQGAERLIDYSATKGAVVSLTRSLARAWAGEGIRVNAVAPGPVWTPLQPASRPAEELETFGSGTDATPMGRAGQPFELAEAYVFLAAPDSAFMTGQILHVDGGSFGFS